MSSALGSDMVGSFSRSTKVPALGQAVTWRFDGGVAVAGARLEVQSLTSTRPVVWNPIATVSADARGVAFYQASFDHPAFMSLRAVPPDALGGVESASPGLQASWRGTGACPLGYMEPGPYAQPDAVTGPDGTRYQVTRGWDANGDMQSSLAADATGVSWRHAFEPCYGVSEPVFDGFGTADVVASRHTVGVIDSRVYAFGPAGMRSSRPYEVAGDAALLRAPDGTVYVRGIEFELGTGGTMSAWSRSTLAALDASGQPSRGWPYETPLPMSAPAFGPEGSTYIVLGYVLGSVPHIPPGLGEHMVARLDRDGKVDAGWPFVLSDGVGPLHASLSEGEIAVPEPPVVGPDGTVYVAAGKGDWGDRGNLVLALTPDGALLPAWPFATVLSDGALDSRATGGSPGALPPVPAAGGRVYIAARVGSGPAAHDEIIVVGSGGDVLDGWPYPLPGGVDGAFCQRAATGAHFLDGECWLGLMDDGVVRTGTVSHGTAEPPVCLRADGTPETCGPG